MAQSLLAAPPVAVDDYLTLPEDQAAVIILPSLIANDSDPDGDPVTVISAFSTVNGSLSILSGNLVFTPAANFVGTGSFGYMVTDGQGGTDTATVFIQYTAVDDPPVNLLPQAQNTTEDTPITIPGLGVADVDAVEGNFTANLSVTNGTLTVSGGAAAIVGNGTGDVTLTGTIAEINSTLTNTVIYAPPTNFFGTVTLTMKITDPDSGSRREPLSDVDELTINVAPVNDLPIANDDDFASAQNQPTVIELASLLANDSDVDGDPLTVISAFSAVNGSLSIVSGKLVFTPATDFVGIGSFKYMMTDGQGATAIATIRIVVGVLPTLNAIHPASGSYQFYVNGDIGGIYRIEVSTNLTQWTFWKTVTNSAASTLVIDNEAPGLAHRFYRVEFGP